VSIPREDGVLTSAPQPSWSGHRPPSGPRDPHAIAPLNLRLDAAELRALLGTAVRSEDWEDAFLLAGAINQIAEDALHRDVYVLGEAARILRERRERKRVLLGGALGAAVSATKDARAWSPDSRRLQAWQTEVAALVGVLASLTWHELSLAEIDRSDAASRARSQLAALGPIPDELHEHVPRLPACFQAFDLDLEDIRTLTDRFVATHADRDRPLLVLGIRTSGSYLAPLCTALLESLDYSDVGWITVRPQQGLLRRERELVRELAQRGGSVVVVDDPPASGHSVATVAEGVIGLGVPREATVLMLPLFGADGVPPASLRDYASITLAETEWAVRERLRPDVVARTFERLVGDGSHVAGVTPAPLARPRRERDHTRERFVLDVVGPSGRHPVDVIVEGVGVGYFGRHAIAVADALSEHVPEVFGIDRNLLYRRWLSDEARGCLPGEAPGDELVEAIAEYVYDRKRRLRVVHDHSVETAGERAVWEVASEMMSRPFARGARLARVLLAGTLSRHLLRVSEPCVVDGETSPSNWFTEGREPTFSKVDFARRSFWNLGLLCYDPAFDLAGAAIGAGDDGTAGRLRSAYAELGGGTVGDARWFLYELAQLWGLQRADTDGRLAVEPRFARSLQRYLAGLYLADLEPSRDGDLCVLDLDGVLETNRLGFPGMTASAALALRALIAHGFCPAIVSGRSVGEIEDRIRTYGLVGGAGEYGAVVVTDTPGDRRVLLSEQELEALEAARRDLALSDGVKLDGAYRYSVRAFRTDSKGRRSPPARGLTDSVIERSAEGPATLRAVIGDDQTDFVAARVDKGLAVRALAAALGRGGEPRKVALAVGDTGSDVPMLDQAALAFAPAHARKAFWGTGVEIVGAPYQAGLAQAVGKLLGHAPGTCPVCKAPELSEDDALLVSLLSVGERGRVRLVARFLRLRRDLKAATAAGGRL